MKNEYTGPLREMWNYFKRGKGELNFLLNVYQTLVIIWGVEAITESNSRLVLVTVAFGVALFASSLVIGKYSLTKVDTTLPYLNPFAQDIVVFRGMLARGFEYIATGDMPTAALWFQRAQEITERWTAEND